MSFPIKRYFDKSISSKWYKQLICLLVILVVFLSPSFFFAFTLKDFKFFDAIEVFMSPSEFGGKVHQISIYDGNTQDDSSNSVSRGSIIKSEKPKFDLRYWGFLITALAGSIAFAGVLISMCGNFIQQRVDKFGKGYVNYKFKNHQVILGYDEIVPALVKQIIKDKVKHSKDRIVLMTAQDVERVREVLFTNLNDAEQSYLVLVHGNRLSKEALENIHISKADCVYLIGEDVDMDHDTMNINCLRTIAQLIPDNNRISCKTFLRNHSTFTLFQTNDIIEEVKGKIDFLPFNFDETWARKVFVSCESNINEIIYQNLDRGGIDKDSEKYVHLIVIGMTQMGITLGMEATHICHFPNFKTKGKKTKITFIDECADAEMKYVVSANDRFFRNCKHWYSNNGIDWEGSYPEHDFLDVEFEFLKGNIADSYVRDYIEKCVDNYNELLTIASCLNDTAKALATGLYLPDAVYDKGLTDDEYYKCKMTDNQIVVLVRQNTSAELLNIVKNGEAKYKRYRNVYPFGMLSDGCEFDETLAQWGKRLNYLYCVIDQLNGVPSVYPGDIVEEKWNECSVSDKWSNIYNVMTIPTKLRSVGYNYKSATFNGLTSKEIEILAEVEHNRWNVEKLLMGFRPVTKKEEEEIDPDISKKDAFKANWKAHYDLRPFDDLKPDKSGKNVDRYDYEMTKGIIGIIK